MSNPQPLTRSYFSPSGYPSSASLMHSSVSLPPQTQILPTSHSISNGVAYPAAAALMSWMINNANAAPITALHSLSMSTATQTSFLHVPTVPTVVKNESVSYAFHQHQPLQQQQQQHHQHQHQHQQIHTQGILHSQQNPSLMHGHAQLFQPPKTEYGYSSGSGSEMDDDVEQSIHHINSSLNKNSNYPFANAAALNCTSMSYPPPSPPSATHLSPNTTKDIIQQLSSVTNSTNSSTHLSLPSASPSSATSATSSSSATPRDMEEFINNDTTDSIAPSPAFMSNSSSSSSGFSSSQPQTHGTALLDRHCQWRPISSTVSDKAAKREREREGEDSPCDDSLVSRVKKPTLRKKREAFRYDKETRRIKRLENHRRYDRKRKQALDTVFFELRAVIQSSMKISKSSRLLLSDDAASATSNASNSEKQKQRVHVKQEKGEYETEFDERERESEFGDDDLTLPSLAENDLENLSQYELFSTAADAIRSLYATKAKLEKFMEADEPQHIKADDDHANPCLMPPSDVALTSKPSSAAADSAFDLDLTSLSLDEQHKAKFLLAAIRVAEQSYADQCAKYRSLTERIPNVLLDSVDSLPPYCVFALNGVNLVTVLQPHIMKRYLGEDMLKACWPNDMLSNSHRAQVLQHFTICSLLSSTMKQILDKETSAHAANSSSTLKVEQENEFEKVRADVPTYLYQSMHANSNKDFSHVNDAHIASATPHPLQPFGIAKESASIVRDITVWLASLEPHEFQEQYDKLRQSARDIAEQNNLDSQYKMPSLPRITANDSDRSPIDYMFNPYFQFDHEQIRGLADLLTGKEKVISFKRYAVISPSDKCLYLDCDASLLIHPDTGQALGVFGFVQRMYWGDRFVPKCPMRQHDQLYTASAPVISKPHAVKNLDPTAITIAATHMRNDPAAFYVASTLPSSHASTAALPFSSTSYASDSPMVSAVSYSTSLCSSSGSGSGLNTAPFAAPRPLSTSCTDADVEFAAAHSITRCGSNASSGSDSDGFLESETLQDSSTVLHLQQAYLSSYNGGFVDVTPPMLYSSISSAINSSCVNSADLRGLPSTY